MSRAKQTQRALEGKEVRLTPNEHAELARRRAVS